MGSAGEENKQILSGTEKNILNGENLTANCP